MNKQFTFERVRNNTLYLHGRYGGPFVCGTGMRRIFGDPYYRAQKLRLFIRDTQPTQNTRAWYKISLYQQRIGLPISINGHPVFVLDSAFRIWINENMDIDLSTPTDFWVRVKVLKT